MKLIMESWRQFRVTETEDPKFKEDRHDSIALLKALSTEKDEQKRQKVLQQMLADRDVAELLGDVEEMFRVVLAADGEDVEELDEDLADLGLSIGKMGLDMSAKLENFLDKTDAGKAIRQASPALLGLVLGTMMLQGGELTPGGIRTVTKLVSGGTNPETLGNVVADMGTEIIDSLDEQKKI